MTAKAHRWRHSAIALTASLGLLAPNAMALSLGRVAVQSALGEPLRAEVEILSINAEEAASLKTTLASPESFKAAGLEYNATTSSIQASLQRLPDGRSYIRLSSERAINEPFVDLILETSWASGRIVRDYTLLFDPPHLRTAAQSAPTPAQVTVQSTARQPNAGVPVMPAATASSRARPTKPVQVATKAPTGSGEQVTVKPGDTAGRIAVATKPGNVSLDQMLVALLRANPQAFMGDNVNRIKAGSVVNIPTAEQVGATPAAEATQMIIAQSKDFNDFRRKLAANAPETTLPGADRKASGAIQARVEDKRPIATTPDKLTLSKGSVQNLSAQDQTARERESKDLADRAAEISRNISDLGKLGTASSAAATRPVPAVSVAGAASSPVASLPSGASASVPAPAPSMAVKQPPAVAASVPRAGAGPLDQLVDNPLVPVAAVSLLALLAFFGLYRARQRKNAPQTDGGLPESPLTPDGYFAASGGQSVDTHDGAAASSTTGSGPVQAAEVKHADPVAEAEVYLAYGRDLQAEEILKDALRANPQRIAIHQKLLELFAKRHDVKSFESTAMQAFELTDGEGADWQRVRELGLEIDAANPRYLPGWRPVQAGNAPSMPLPQSPGDSAGSKDSAAGQTITPQAGGAADLDLDLDLDFSLDDEPAEAIRETSTSSAQTTRGTLQTEPVNPEPQAAAAQASHEMLKFDLGSLSLDLDDAADPEAGKTADVAQDPLATKLALAEEFSAIGDVSGARALIEEVISEASGEMKLKAQRALGKIQSA